MAPGWRLKQARAVAAPAVLLAYALAFYYPLVFLGRMVVDYDALVYFMPQREHLAQALRAGELPLWNPYLFMGAPFLANPQTAVLYPPSWLFALGPVHAVYSLQLVLHTFLAALFAYLLGRHTLGVGALAALTGALAYGFGGFMVGQTGHLNQLSAAPWLPALILAYDQAVRRSSLPWLGLAAAALGLQVLAGHPQETYMSLVALALFALVRAPWRRPRALLTAGGLAIATVGLGLALAAAQLLPTLELVPLSVRGTGVRWEDAVAGSLPPYLVPRALFPPFWWDVASTEYLGYVGVVPVALGFLALVGAPSRHALFGTLLCFVGLFLAPGENNGYYGLLFAELPGFDTFRVPARWLFLWGFGAAVLASLGADWIARGAQARLAALRHPGTWARFAFVALVLASGFQWQGSDGEPFPRRLTPALYAALAALAVASGFLAAAGRRRDAALGLVALTGVELWVAADWSPARQAPPAAVMADASPALGPLVAAGPDVRLLSVTRPDYLPSGENALRGRLEGLSEPIIQSAIVATKWRDTLTPNLPLAHRLRSADGYDGGVLPLATFVRLAGLAIPPDQVRPDGMLISRIEGVPPRRPLEVMGISHVLAGPEATPAGDAAGDLRLVAVAPRPPLARLVYAAEVADDDLALARLADPAYDPAARVALAPHPSAVTLDRVLPGQAVAADEERPGYWRGRISAAADGYLVLREAWYPGWRAWVDGEEVAVLRADVLFRAVPVPAGERAVEWRYQPTSFQRGVLISTAALVATLGLLAWPIARRGIPIIRHRVRRREPRAA